MKIERLISFFIGVSRLFQRCVNLTQSTRNVTILKNSLRVKQITNELDREKAKNSRLQILNDQLRSNHIASTKNAVNVIVKTLLIQSNEMYFNDDHTK